MGQRHTRLKDIKIQPVDNIWAVFDSDSMEMLGKGEFGSVMAVRASAGCPEELLSRLGLKAGDEYAMKALPHKTDDNLASYKHEASVLEFLARDSAARNVVRLYSCMEDSDSLYMVVELLRGGTILERIAGATGPAMSFSEHTAAQWMRQILRCLVDMHAKGVVHLDLKLENVVFKMASAAGHALDISDDALRLIDLGSSIVFDDSEYYLPASGSRKYCTPARLAVWKLIEEAVDKPEAEAVDIYDEKNCMLTKQQLMGADVYAAGIMLHILVTGVHPWDGDHVKMATTKFSDLPHGESYGKLSASLRDLIEQMLDPKDDTRTTAAEALEHPWIADPTRASTTPIDWVFPALMEYRTANKLKKVVARLLVDYMTTADKAVAKAAFAQLDTKKEGFLEAATIAEVAEHSGHIPDSSTAKLVVDDFTGPTRGGKISLSEFSKLISMIRVPKDSKYLGRLFDHLDSDKDGFLNGEDIMRVVSAVRESDEAAVSSAPAVAKGQEGRVYMRLSRLSMGRKLTPHGFDMVDAAQVAKEARRDEELRATVAAILRESDLDRDGRLSRDEFMHAMDTRLD